MSDIRIVERYIYPVKSLPGVRLSKMEIGGHGPILDRQWMIVDEENKAVTLRTRPDLTLFRVALGNFVELAWKDGDMMDFGLSETEGDTFNVKSFESELDAQEVSGEVSEWLSSKLDKKVKLVRQLDKNFVDSKPVLVISKASLDLLDMKVGKRTALSRFRPNIIIDNIEAHEEDLIEGFIIGPVEFHFSEKCSRSETIQVNPLTGEVGKEPMETLNSYRKEEDGKVYFGSYYTTVGTGTV